MDFYAFSVFKEFGNENMTKEAWGHFQNTYNQ